MSRFKNFYLGVLMSLNAPAMSPAPLEIAVEDAAWPWSNKDGSGYAVDLVKAAFDAKKIDIQFKIVPYARCKFLAIEGKVVACFSASPEPGLDKLITFSDAPLFTLYSDFFQNTSHPIKVKSKSTIPKGSIVGVVNDYEYPFSLEALKEQGIVIEKSNDEVTLLKKLALGRLDVAIINHNQLKSSKFLLKQADVFDKVQFAFRGGDLNTYLVFSKKNPLAESARKSFNDGHREIIQNGVATKIYRLWLKKVQADFDTRAR